VTPDYFRATGIRLIAGRVFSADDTKDSKRVCIINEMLATRYFAGEDPIGKRIHVTNGPETFREVVGIVADVKQQGLDKITPAQFYEPLAQYPFPGVTFIVRSSKDVAVLGTTIRKQVLEIDSEQPVSNIQPLSRIISTSIAQQRFHTLLLTIFAAVALVLAGVGLYGVIAYSVTQRRHEIGIRMALGASSSNVLKMILGQGMVLACAGAAIGLVASFILTRLVSSWLAGMLFEVGASDAVTFTLIPVVLVAVAMLASYIPARRATKVDPMVALRYE
jgi:putative ABC transport system permease protein